MIRMPPFRKTGMVQWWEHSPLTNVSQVQFPNLIYVGWVCCWFSFLLQEIFLRMLQFSPLFKNQHFQISIWSGIVKHFIMCLWLVWSRKHSLCLTLNLHLHYIYKGKNNSSHWKFRKKRVGNAVHHSTPTNLRKAKTFLNDKYLKNIKASSDRKYFHPRAKFYHSFGSPSALF